MDTKQELALIESLNKRNPGAIDEAVKVVREEGGLKILGALVNNYSKENSPNQLTISTLFNDLRDESVIGFIADQIKDQEDTQVRKMLLTACWQSRLNFIEHLEIFILVTLSQPFEFSFEAFTVIENNDSKVSGSRKADLISFVKDNLSKCTEENMALAHELVAIIGNYEEA